MENLPPLPSFEEDQSLKVYNTIEFEVEKEGERFLFVFQINLDVRYDPETKEIVIDCTEERVDSIY